MPTVESTNNTPAIERAESHFLSNNVFGDVRFSVLDVHHNQLVVITNSKKDCLYQFVGFTDNVTTSIRYEINGLAKPVPLPSSFEVPIRQGEELKIISGNDRVFLIYVRNSPAGAVM